MAREHRVALSEPAIAILSDLRRNSGHVFPGQKPHRPLSNMAMLQCLRGIRGEDSETVHGFRSSFRGWAAEQTDYPREIIEACLAHEVGSAVELAYRRTDFLDKRRGADGGVGEVVLGQVGRGQARCTQRD